MTTFAHRVPSLDARILGASLIIVGTVEDDIIPSLDYGTDPPQVHSTFRIAVQDTLRGQPPGPSVEVRFIGGQVEEVRTPATLQVTPRQRVLAFLAPYYAVDADPETFVVYFNSYYPVSQNDTIELDPSAPATIDSLRAAIRNTQDQYEQQQRLVAQLADQAEPDPAAAQTRDAPADAR